VAREVFIMADGARLPYRAWLPSEAPRAVLLGLHGFGDYSLNAFDVPAPLFVPHGVALYAYDQRGFGAAPHRGLWPGAATLAGDATAVARLLRARHPGAPLFMLGESMGAAVLLVAATSGDPPPASGYVLSAPGVRGRATMGRVARVTLEFASRAIPAVGFIGSAPGFAPTDNEAAMRRWSNDPLTTREFRVDLVYGLVNLMDDALAVAPYFDANALVLAGGRDRIVPPSAIRRLVASMPPAAPRRVAYYPDGHHLLLRDQGRAAVAADVMAWMTDSGAPLPSGADEGGRRWMHAQSG
jgi:alpha-beta hydrolase superfamily lysophospholipase